ncbi:MAG: GWxTD domain-containing protein [Bryobacteraceae bacterium]|nr:GWxTD domain-containing protein [Bryobacteraceae bacterium]
MLFASISSYAADTWLERVAPVIDGPERARYLSLATEDERASFREAFWEGKAITSEQYFARVTYVDDQYGSSRPGSGANTDQGRIYLALGAPTAMHRVPSSRIFVPTEIWYYDHVPGLTYSSRLQLLFYRPRDTGLYKLYSPRLNTLRALLLPQAGMRGLFGVNDELNANDILNQLNVPPGEQEIVDASMSVGRGITGSGNSEILALVASPRAMFNRKLVEATRSRVRFAEDRPKFTYQQYATPENLVAIDLQVSTKAQNRLTIEVPGVDLYETNLGFDAPRPVVYSQRLFLLPGRYYVQVMVDGLPDAFPVEVSPLTADLAKLPADAQLTYRANLFPGAAWSSAGRQYARRGQVDQARTCFRNALSQARTPGPLAGLAQLEAAAGRLDAGRALVEEALKLDARHFDSLVTLAAITAEFQDYALAATYLERALAIRRTPAVEAMLKQLRK